MKGLVLVMLLTLGAEKAGAQWSGRPWATNPAMESWYEVLNMPTNPLVQLIEAINERAAVASRPAFEYERAWTCFAGFSNEVIIVTNTGAGYTNILTITNRHRLTTQITTNALGFFTYTYTNEGHEFSASAYSYVTAQLIEHIGDRIAGLTYYFASTSCMGGSHPWGDYYDGLEDDGWNHPRPRESLAGICMRQGIGFATNLNLTNGFIYNGSGYWTKHVENTGEIMLAACVFDGSSNWSFSHISELLTRLGSPPEDYYPGDALPIVRYNVGGTNPFASITISVTGNLWIASNQTTPLASETLTLFSTNEPLTNRFYWITAIDSPSAAANIGDQIAVLYTNPITIYGHYQRRLAMERLDEYATALDQLIVTYHEREAHYGDRDIWTNLYPGITAVTWKAENYVGDPTSAITYLVTNWTNLAWEEYDPFDSFSEAHFYRSYAEKWSKGGGTIEARHERKKHLPTMNLKR